MLDREVRLGDVIDDFCIKCKRIMNHAVVSTLDGKPAKVRCRTCYNDHDFRHEQAPPPKIDPRKAAAALLAAEAAGAGALPLEGDAPEDGALEGGSPEAMGTVKAKAKKKAK